MTGTAPIRSADPAAIAAAARLLRDSGLVAFPTETVYGLGADATDGPAVARIFAAKQRPSFNPLISHLAEASAAAAFADLNPKAEKLAEAFWPGPLTLVLPRRADCAIADIASAGLDTVALRVPAHPVAHALLRETGRPVAAPSANRSGRVSPTRAEHVAAELGTQVDMILDGGPCEIGLESTVVRLNASGACLLRPGGITRAEIEGVIGQLGEFEPSAAKPTAPGQLPSHYAPAQPVRMNAMTAQPGEVLLGFGPDVPGTVNLSETGDLAEAAANLFAALHQLGNSDAQAIAVAPVPDTGLGIAINDRLRRAAAPRT